MKADPISRSLTPDPYLSKKAFSEIAITPLIQSDTDENLESHLLKVTKYLLNTSANPSKKLLKITHYLLSNILDDNTDNYNDATTSSQRIESIQSNTNNVSLTTINKDQLRGFTRHGKNKSYKYCSTHTEKTKIINQWCYRVYRKLKINDNIGFGYTLSRYKNPDAVDMIENTLFENTNTIYRPEIVDNIFILPLKNYIYDLANNMYSRLENYMVRDVNFNDVKFVDIVYNDQEYNLPLVKSFKNDGIILVPLCIKYNRQIRKWVSLSPMEAKISIPDAPIKMLLSQLVSLDSKCCINYDDIDYYIPTSFQNDPATTYYVIHSLVSAEYRSIRQKWHVKNLPFKPYQGLMTLMSLKDVLANQVL
jgi:hypothetical protein